MSSLSLVFLSLMIVDVQFAWFFPARQRACRSIYQFFSIAASRRFRRFDIAAMPMPPILFSRRLIWSPI